MKWYKIKMITITSVFLMDCQSTVTPIVLQINNLLNDDSSKVWMLTSEQINGKEISEHNKNFKKVFVFYNDMTYCEQTLNRLGNSQPRYGTYQISNQNNNLILIANRDTVNYIIQSYSKQAIELVSNKKQEDVRIVLIPLPKI